MITKTSLDEKITKNWSGCIFNADKELITKESISTGSIQLDKALGVDGIPVGRIIEIFGNESSGKTTIALHIIKEAQKKNKRCLFIDAEHSIDVNYLKSIGIDTKKLLIANPLSGEQVFDMMEFLIKQNLIDLIVVDSVAAMVPNAEIETKMEENQLGAHARMMSKGLRKLQAVMNTHESTVIFLNQVREKIGVFFGNPEVTPGGKALKFFSTIRIEARKCDLIKDNNDKIGIISKLTIVKNKLSAPLKTAFINIYFNNGYDPMNEIIEFSINYNIINKNGSWFYFEEQKLAQGKEQLKKYMKNNPEIFNKIKQITLEKINIT